MTEGEIKDVKRQIKSAMCKCGVNRKWKEGDCPVCVAKKLQRKGDKRELEVIYDEILSNRIEERTRAAS